MPKFPFKRPRIISKNFPEMGSSIDGVTKSLNELVFSYSEKVDKTLQKKHLMMALSSMTLILVLGSFISPKGKADSSIFYPDTCLGGWINPQYAQGEQETTSNGDSLQFTKDNSAVLPKNTNAEMYCGNFKGKFDTTTKPTKIIVSLALTKGEDLLLEDTMESGLVPSTSTLLEVVVPGDVHNSVDGASTTSLDSATTSVAVDSALVPTAGTSSSVAADENLVVGSTSPTNESSTTVVTPYTPPSVVDGIVESVKDAVNKLFEPREEIPQGTTDTVVVPPLPQESVPDVPAPASSVDQPTSYTPSYKENILSFLFERVLAEEPAVVDSISIPLQEAVTTVPQESETSQHAPQNTATVEEVPPPLLQVAGKKELILDDSVVDNTTSGVLQEISTTTFLEQEKILVEESASTSTSTVSETSSETSLISSSTSGTSTTTGYLYGIASTTVDVSLVSREAELTAAIPENQFQNNFLEVLYTFDGLTWLSLGDLNEISMKYRTFEIPVTATTSWEDMRRLQIKVVATKHDKDTPAVYLDAIKVEVLYETTFLHEHPDFSRDTILKDETIGGMRIVTLINSETNLEEIWYMYLAEVVQTASSSTLLTATSTQVSATGTTSNSSNSMPTLEKVESVMQNEIQKNAEEAPLISSGTSTSVSSTTLDIATSSTQIEYVIQKNTWRKFEGIHDKKISGAALAETIRTLDEKKMNSKDQLKREKPDFTIDFIRKIKGTFSNLVVVQLEKEGNEELWLYDVEKGTEENLALSTSTAFHSSSPLGVKDGHIFWLSKDNEQVFAYTIETKTLQEVRVPAYDPSKGERGEVMFEGIPWKVIIGEDTFLFYSDATGEVFSDENGAIAETLRRKLDLDNVLDKEALSNLNFHVDDTVGTDE